MGIRLVGALRRIPGMSTLLLKTKTPLAGVLIGMQFHDTLSRMGRSKVAYIAAIMARAGHDVSTRGRSSLDKDTDQWVSFRYERG